MQKQQREFQEEQRLMKLQRLEMQRETEELFRLRKQHEAMMQEIQLHKDEMHIKAFSQEVGLFVLGGSEYISD